MKITKSYLKQVIKEELQKLTEDENRKTITLDGIPYNVVYSGKDLLQASGPTGLVNDKEILKKIKAML